MMVPQLSDAQMSRLRSAYYAGVSTDDIVERFGIGPKQVHDAVRGRVPLIYSVSDDPVNMEDEGLLKKRRVKSCKLHLLDLITEYRPEVLAQYKARRKAALEASIFSKIVVEETAEDQEGQEEDSVENHIIPPSLTRRSVRIFRAGLKRFKMTADEMTGPTRTNEYVRARQILMFAIYTECLGVESTPSVGRMFKKDHSTVVHAVHRVRKSLEAGDPKITEHVNALREVK